MSTNNRPQDILVEDIAAYAKAELRDIRKWTEGLSISAAELREMQALEAEAVQLLGEMIPASTVDASNQGKGTVKPD